MKSGYKEYFCGVCDYQQMIVPAQFCVSMPVCERCGQKILWRKVPKKRSKPVKPQGLTWESPTPPGFYDPPFPTECPF